MKKSSIAVISIASVLLVGSIAATIISAVKAPQGHMTKEVYTFQSWYDELNESYADPEKDKTILLPSDVANESDFINAAARKIASIKKDCVYDEAHAIKNRGLTKEDFAKLGQNQIILFQGHGSYETSRGSTIWTKNQYGEDQSEEYKDDCKNGRIIEVVALENEAVTSKYIEKYCPDLTGSFVYLGQCESGKDATLANAFLAKNAAAVIGNTETIQARYGDAMEYTVCSYLATINKETGNYYTLQEALLLARAKYGDTDQTLYPYCLGAKPIIFGDKNYRAFNVKNPIPGSAVPIFIGIGIPSILAIIGGYTSVILVECKNKKKENKVDN